MSNVLHVPGLSVYMLSVQRFAKDNGVFFEFHPNCFFVEDFSTKVIMFRGHATGGLYSCHVSHQSPAAIVATRASPSVWHNRLGSPSFLCLTSDFKFLLD